MTDEQHPAEAVAPPSPVAQRAAAALARHAWREAFDLLAAADAEGTLAPVELELYAQAAWWTGRLPLAIDARERAFGAATQAGDGQTAVMLAFNLARDNLLRNDVPVAEAWLTRGEHLLDGVPENVGHGYLAACRSFAAALSGNPNVALEMAETAAAIAERTGDRDLAAFATSERGFALVMIGEVERGMALIDEASIAAVGGELEPATAGGVCCASIEACAVIGDWTRAASWTEAQDRWCRREGISGYPGMCRLFRSEIKQFRGSWLEAEAEARQASVELEGFMPAAAGRAFLRIADLRLLRGDLPAAEEALVRTHALGMDPEPVLSLLRLAQGRLSAAAAGIRQALDEPTSLPNWRAPPGTPLHRLPLLRALVEIALARDDLTTARAAADEVAGISQRYRTDFTVAIAETALGWVELREGRATDAAQRLRRAVQGWGGLAAPHELARARVHLADAYLATDEPERALLELQAARAGFEQVGAAPALRETDARIAAIRSVDGEEPSTTAERVTRTFVFTDIVDSTRLAELLGDEAWSSLLRWHDNAIRRVVAEHGGEEIKATGDGFFLAFREPDAAVEAMIAVQRRLAAQREEHGFAPAVRIGAHLAQARRTGVDYLGLGVNYAARIGAAAEGSEILVSESTLAAARRPFPHGPRRTLKLHGITEPVEVAPIEWR